jgi:hypothetical protein
VSSARHTRFLLCSLLAAAVGSAGAAEQPAAERPDPREVLKQAKREALAIPAQARALVGLAWPAPGPADPLVQALARQELVHFGSHALPVLREAVKQVDPLYRADVTATLIEARRSERFSNSPDFLPGLEEAIWFGSVEARRLAMIELSRYPFPPAVLTIIDAIHQEPELMVNGLRALSRMRNERTRFFLKRVLHHGAPRYQRLAAEGLGRLAESGIPLLREATAAQDRGVRETALAAWIPYAAPEDVTLLHEYVTAHGDDDPDLLRAARDKALELEAALEREHLAEAATSEP